MIELSSVYKITDGCLLNDDLELLKYEMVDIETKDFYKDMADKEVAIKSLNLKDGIVFGKTYDGDSVLYRNDKSVLLYNHEDFTLSETYDNIWKFILENC